jgi:hypothetical protein
MRWVRGYPWWQRVLGGAIAGVSVWYLVRLLVEANDAFDECTGDYPKELVEGESWRRFRR